MIYHNRRGQVAILMLFVVTIVLVIATLFVFFSSKAAAPPSSGFSETIALGNSNFESVEEMAKQIAKESITTKGSFSGIANTKYKVLRDLGEVQVAPYGNFFVQVENKEVFSFGVAGAGYKLNVTGLFVQASFGNNNEMKNFDLCMLFDGKGNYLEELANEELYKISCGK